MNEKQWDKLAGIYHREIISPFYGEVENPIYEELEQIEGKEHKAVAEFGCGHFHLAPVLSKQFKSVHASDFSERMVEHAIQNSKGLHNVAIIREDMTELGHNNVFDVIITVNSIIMPSACDVKKSLENLHSALKSGGRCLFIMPSMESVLYHGMLLFHTELDEKNEDEAAKKATRRKAEYAKYDYLLGHYKEGDNIQKFYYKHEVEFLLKKAGFTDIEITKVKYPWGKDISDYKDFPGEEPLWDWFVKAKKA